MTDLFIDNKYTLWYGNIIANAKARSKPVCYTEKHHIIPKSLGGDKSPENIVILTAREHFICHWLLTKMVKNGQGRFKLGLAFNRMMCKGGDNQRRYYPTGRLYELARVACNKSMIGRIHTQETRSKISENHHDVSGANNPRAKKYKLTSPAGEIFYIHGILRAFCREHNLSLTTLIRTITENHQPEIGKNIGWTIVPWTN